MAFSRNGVATSIIALSVMALTGPAFAQDNGGEQASDQADIIVTAQRRAERSRDVPITVATLGQEQLTTANVASLSDTAKLTPGLRFDAAGSNVQPTIRGVGTAVATSGGGPNVGIYVDGFFQSNPYVADFQLMNVKSIQVLKGPQGTLFGRNTTGGAILVTTAEPSTTPGAEFKASYGSFNALSLQGYATYGLSDRIAVDVEGMYRSGDGYVRNLVTSDPHAGKYENWSIRTGVKAELTDKISVLLRYSHNDVNDPSTLLANAYVDQEGTSGLFSKLSAGGLTAYGNPTGTTGLPLVYYPLLNFAAANCFCTTAPGTIRTADTPKFTNKSDTFQGTIKADLGFADLTSYTQFRKDNGVSHQDLDASAIQAFYISIGVKDKTFSQEFLLNSKPGGPLQWTAGLNYFQNRDTWDIGASFSGSPFFPFGGSSTNTKSFAAFADVTYQATDKLFLTLGGRFSHDLVSDAWFRSNGVAPFYEAADGSFQPTGPAGTVIPVATLKNDRFTPRVVVRYKPNEDSSVYASYTRGYKAGILNVGGLSQVPVKPETIDAFEVGYKYDDRTLAVDLAAFYYNYKNLQVSSYQNGAAQIRNAATSEIYGLDGQLRYRVTSDFNVNIGAAWTHARYKSFTNAPFYSYCDPTAANTSALWCVPTSLNGLGDGSLAQTTTNASGYHMQRSPEFTANVGASYGMDVAKGRLTLSGNLYYTSSFYFDPEQQFKQKAYEILSLRAQWTDKTERYTVAVYGDNLTDRRYKTQVLFNTLGIGNTWSSPATWGVSLGAKF